MKATKFREQVRKAIEKSGMSGYALAKASGVTEATISRFHAGADISLSTLEKLAGPLKLELRMKGDGHGKR